VRARYFIIFSGLIIVAGILYFSSTGNRKTVNITPVVQADIPVTVTTVQKQKLMNTLLIDGMLLKNNQDTSAFRITINIPGQEAFKLKRGSAIDITTDIYTGHKYRGEVVGIATRANTAHTYPVEIVVQNENGYPLAAGQPVHLSITTLTPDETLTIPRQAIIGPVKMAKVYRIKKGKANLRSVVIGRQSSEFVEILNGVSKGDTIVVTGQNNLVNGTRVSIIEK
jgi:membrane fusion protein (multidrug efflux system)